MTNALLALIISNASTICVCKKNCEHDVGNVLPVYRLPTWLTFSDDDLMLCCRLEKSEGEPVYATLFTGQRTLCVFFLARSRFFYQ